MRHWSILIVWAGEEWISCTVGALGLGNLAGYFTDGARGLKNRNGALTIACGKHADRGALTIASEHAAEIKAGALTIALYIGPAH